MATMTTAFARWVAIAAAVALPLVAVAQDRATSAGAVVQGVHGVGTTARVLMIGAHPDDEDTALIAFLARGRQVETAYLSLTRGDGGQNLIGNELGESLGAIRTEELLAARRVDYGRQYFSRAFDFGYSKDSAETLSQWDREELLGDVVRVIRAFRPHVVVAVFAGMARDGHGHHQVAGLLAREAYELAGDMLRFPRSFGEPWTPAKLYRSARFQAEAATLRVNVGEFDVLSGRSYGEISGESRSQHKSQGFGAAERRGVLLDPLRREATRVNASTAPRDELSIFDGVDTTWARHRAAAVRPALQAVVDSLPLLSAVARATLDVRVPSTAVPVLARMVALLEAAQVGARCEWAVAEQPCTEAESDLATSVRVAHERATAALVAAAGVQLELLSDRPFLAFGDTADITLRVDNRGLWPVTVRGFALTGALGRVEGLPVTIAADSGAVITHRMAGVAPQGAWWLMTPREGAMFDPFTSSADGLRTPVTARLAPVVRAVAVAEDARAATAAGLTLEIAGVRFTHVLRAVVHRRVDPVRGEIRTPLTPVPAISLLFDRQLELARANVDIARVIRLQVRSYSSRRRTVRLRYELPPGVTADSLPSSMTLGPLETQEISIRLRGRLPEGRNPLVVQAEEVVADDAGGRFNGTFKYNSGWFTIDYPHIRPVVVFRSSGVWVQGVETALPTMSKSIAYVPGVSDDGIPILRQLGVRVTEIAPEQLGGVDLSVFDAVVLGPRVYQRFPRLAESNPTLEAFARAGGTVVVQYGQNELQGIGMLPYPVEMMPPVRVTDEGAAVRVVDARARVLTVPNRIGDDDWLGWVQERSLYMPSLADSAWRTVIAMRDPGEPENANALLTARVGAGTYVYTSLALFRQLPAGVPGGIRLFINLLSAGGR
jgi:LmbE family N-acetylglucosaminyl deacetylase